MNPMDAVMNEGEKKALQSAATRQVTKLLETFQGVKIIDRNYIFDCLGVLSLATAEVYEAMLNKAIIAKHGAKMEKNPQMLTISEDQRKLIFTDAEATDLKNFIASDVKRLDIMFMGATSVRSDLISYIASCRVEIFNDLYLDILSPISNATFGDRLTESAGKTSTDSNSAKTGETGFVIKNQPARATTN